MTNQKNQSQQLIKQLSVAHLDAIIAQNSYVIIDVRNPEDLIAYGAIPGAFNIPYHTVDQAIDSNSEPFQHVFNDSRPKLFICTGGVMSYMAAIKVREHGVTDVYNLKEGFAGWVSMKEEIAVK